MSRSTSQSSTATTSTGAGVSHSLSTKLPAKPQTSSGPVSDVKLFVTNLRLVDLDLRDDWPEITVQTFSAKNADQKQRISGTEWALFRLFELWDPDETAQKLQPFFPPLEPLQSLNLRAALYRSLNELKKNGVLGRESVLRKTMLDECKGEKFYEILATFSNIVLKKDLRARGADSSSSTYTRELATSSNLSAAQQQSLLPLAIAHKAALANVLIRKEKKRRRYQDFQRLLDVKSDEINQRTRKSKDTLRANKHAIPQKEADAVKRQLKDNWIGDQRWLEVMLHGDNVQTQDAFLQSRFDKVWRMVEAGRSLESVVPDTGLLQNLHIRVQEQQDRLQKWKAFHDDLQKQKQPVSQQSSRKAAVKEFIFDEHLQYQLPSNKAATPPTKRRDRALPLEYADLLADMDHELLQASKSRPRQTSTSLSRRRRSSSGSKSPLLSRKNTRIEVIPKVPTSPTRTSKPPPNIKKISTDNVPTLRATRQVPITNTPIDSEATLIGYTSALRSNTQSTYNTTNRDHAPQHHEPQREETPPSRASPEESSSSPPAPLEATPPRPHHQPSPESTPIHQFAPPIPILQPPLLTAEEALATQIVDSLAAATPSPIKKPQPRMSLSLVERTRMSMARTTSFPPISESPSLPQGSSPQVPSSPPPIPLDDETHRRATLLERTRQSMLAMQARPNRQSLAPREKRDRKSRASLFPVNQFDTPRNRKSFEILEEAKSSVVQRTPRESLLLDDDVDYDRVFRSRPRVATSPAPERFGDREGDGVDGEGEEFDEGVTGIDLGDVDQDEEEGDEMGWAESPIRVKRGVRY